MVRREVLMVTDGIDRLRGRVLACDSRHCTLTLASCARLKFANDPGQDWLGQAERMKGQAKCGLGGRPGRLLLMFLREVRRQGLTFVLSVRNSLRPRGEIR